MKVDGSSKEKSIRKTMSLLMIIGSIGVMGLLSQIKIEAPSAAERASYIEATVTAMSPEESQESFENIPRSLREATIQLDFNREENLNGGVTTYNGSGTGIIYDIVAADSSHGEIITFFTNWHVAELVNRADIFSFRNLYSAERVIGTKYACSPYSAVSVSRLDKDLAMCSVELMQGDKLPPNMNAVDPKVFEHRTSLSNDREYYSYGFPTTPGKREIPFVSTLRVFFKQNDTYVFHGLGADPNTTRKILFPEDIQEVLLHGKEVLFNHITKR